MRNPRYIAVFVTLLILFCFKAGFAKAAILAPAPISDHVEPGMTFAVPILLDSEGESINLVSGVIDYPIQYFTLLSISRGGSFLTLWPEEPKDDPVGHITFAGGIPDGTIASDVPVLTLVFRANTTGKAAISVANTSTVLLNDGAGTPTSVRGKATTMQIAYTDETLPQIQSPTHPEEWKWYSNNNIEIHWNIIPGAFYSYQLSRDPLAEADEYSEGEKGFTNYPSLADGTWYFSLRERIPGEEWGAAQQRVFSIDRTNPNISSITLEDVEDGKHLLSFSTTDDISGIQKTHVGILRKRQLWFPFSFHATWEEAQTPVVLDDLKSIDRIEIRAYDLAGNEAAAQFINPDARFTKRLFLATAVAALFLALLLFVVVRIMRGKEKI